jgi:hypothetical protein
MTPEIFFSAWDVVLSLRPADRARMQTDFAGIDDATLTDEQQAFVACLALARNKILIREAKTIH